jgi:hypothetical protein
MTSTIAVEFVHAATPIPVLNVPVGQLVHVVGEVDPTTEEYVPTEHF